MTKFQTTVYLVDEFSGSSMSDQFSIPLTRLAINSYEGVNEKMAAAEAWIESVGQYHKEKLEQLNAPKVMIEAAESQAFVVGKLELLPLCLNAEQTFVFRNIAEEWLISVDGPNSIFLKN